MYVLSIFVLASNERALLQQTLTSIFAQDLGDFTVTVVLKTAQCPAAEEIRQYICHTNQTNLYTYVQKTDRLETVFAEIADLCAGTHMIIMGADMEMDPSCLVEMVRISHQKPDTIVCASKWHAQSQTGGYAPVRKWLVRRANELLGLFFYHAGKDLISFYQVFPHDLIEKLPFSHSYLFLYEYTLLPLHAGVPYLEIPTSYQKRSEGKSNFSFFYNLKAIGNFAYTAIRIKRLPKTFFDRSGQKEGVQKKGGNDGSTNDSERSRGR